MSRDHLYLGRVKGAPHFPAALPPVLVIPRARHTLAPRALLCSLLLLGGRTLCQDILQHAITSGFEDMAEVKRAAEAGGARAQYKLANSLASRFHSAEALQWYSKAADQGDLESFYQLGRMQLYGAMGVPSGQAVPANPTAGIPIVFRAAKNGHKSPFRDMFRAYKQGLGVPKDIVQAYPWLQLYVDATDGLLPSPARIELNQLAMDVDVATSQQGKRLAALYRSGQWLVQGPPAPKLATPAATPAAAPTLAPAAPPKPRPNLKLSSLVQGTKPVAVINGVLVLVGETVVIPTKPQGCSLKCLSIDPDSVLVSPEGDPEPIRLRGK